MKEFNLQTIGGNSGRSNQSGSSKRILTKRRISLLQNGGVIIFNEMLGIKEIDDKKGRINNREAVRAVIIQNNKILMVHSNLGDYKFPGGGVEKNESHAEGLMREVAEETGYLNGLVGDKMGVVIERHLDDYDKDAVFQMTSHYYLYELTDEKVVVQQLDDYESEQEYTPKWVKLEDAIKQNQTILNQCEQNVWIHRENFVLTELKKIMS
ncbi:NUDIX hydrolase [Metabacillus indicus]|uniref:NUDIX hydrolase n=1 Tax=Metabacillus indicus TaxID=246786 RepID=UPI00319E2301